MKYDLLYENFIEAVKSRIPQNSKISAVLADILLIEKEAVYRRLRRDVPFTFAEIAAVSQKLNISLDNIIGSDPEKSRPLQLKLVDYRDPSEVDYLMLEHIPEMLRKIRNASDSRISINVNTLPLQAYLSYDGLCRFTIFKWAYMTGAGSRPATFGETIISERLRSVQLDTLRELKHVKSTSFVVDNMTFQYIVNNIRYFASIHMIQPEEVELLKTELLRLIDDCENLAVRGRYLDTGNRVQIYISNINFENSYIYFESDGNKLSILKAFLLNGVSSMDDRTFDQVKTWITSLKRVSTLISESGEKERIHFFARQREIIGSLGNES